MMWTKRARYLVRLTGEIFWFSWRNASWTEIVLLLFLALIGALAVSSSTALPFMYTIF